MRAGSKRPCSLKVENKGCEEEGRIKRIRKGKQNRVESDTEHKVAKSVGTKKRSLFLLGTLDNLL